MCQKQWFWHVSSGTYTALHGCEDLRIKTQSTKREPSPEPTANCRARAQTECPADPERGYTSAITSTEDSCALRKDGTPSAIE
jgi:hypothetical protein